MTKVFLGECQSCSHSPKQCERCAEVILSMAGANELTPKGEKKKLKNSPPILHLSDPEAKVARLSTIPPIEIFF